MSSDLDRINTNLHILDITLKSLTKELKNIREALEKSQKGS